MFSLFTIISHIKLHVDIKYCFTEIKCIQVNTLCHCCHVYENINAVNKMRYICR